MGSHKDLFQKIEAIESHFNDGSIKAGQKLLKSLNLDLKSLPSVPNKLRHKHNFVLAQSRYFNDVSSFAVNPKRAEMIKEVQALINDSGELKPRDQANKIHEIQTKWQQLDNSSRPASRDQWEEFKTLTDKAWQPCEEFFAELDSIKIENAIKRREIIASINSYVQSSDFKKNKNLYKYLKNQFDEWQKFAPVRDDDFKHLKQEFSAARKPIFDHLKTIESSNKLSKENLITKVNELSHEDNSENIKAFLEIKNQFQRIQSAGRKNDDRLWKELNAAADKFYAEKKAMADEEILLLKKYIKDELSNSSPNDIESFLQTIKHASKSKEFTEVNKYLLGIKTKAAEEKKKNKLKDFESLIDKIENLEDMDSIPHKIRQMVEKSNFNNDKNLLTEAVIEIEIHANVDSLKKDQSIRDKINLKVLQDKFNSNLNDQEKFYECLEKFFNNLSSKNPNPDEKRLWKRIVKTNPRLS
ncbi:MAG: hypothetical protein CM15mP17_11010 [Gammaproteobacteria bacterium]|nr:MAG: hypothetical protein CM15mP17_11010 [Gammaproteobacteria bacterium]